MSGVAELIDRGGILPILENESTQQDYSPRREGVRQGIVLLMLAVISLSLAGVIASPYHEALVFAFLMAGLMRMIYAALFQDGPSRQPATLPPHQDSPLVTSELNARKADDSLPPASSTPAVEFGGEKTLVEPPSATENTTKLLGDG